MNRNIQYSESQSSVRQTLNATGFAMVGRVFHNSTVLSETFFDANANRVEIHYADSVDGAPRVEWVD